MSKINKTFNNHVGRIPDNRNRTGAQVRSYLEDFVRKRGICTSGEIVKEGMHHFKLSRSQIYSIWTKVKMNNVLKATEEELKQYGISAIKGNTTYWIHIDNSKIRDEFTELIAALTSSNTKIQFLGILGELESIRFYDFLKKGTTEGTDQLLCLLLLMLNRQCPEEISGKYKFNNLRIEASEIADYTHVISAYLKTIYEATKYISKKYEKILSSILEESFNKVLIEDQSNPNSLELVKHLSFIVSDANKQKFNEVIFSSFKNNLVRNSADYDKIYGGIINIENILMYLVKESGYKKLEYRFWRFMWQILIRTFNHFPKDMLSDDEKKKLSEAVDTIMNGGIYKRPNFYKDVLNIMARIRDLSI